VRPERELEAAVLNVGRVKMDAREHHTLEQLDRRFGVPDAGFVGPVGEVGCFDAIAERDDAILMPGQSPVISFGFVEGNDSNRPSAGKQLLRERFQSWRRFEQQALAWPCFRVGCGGQRS
jgi:hypothetical protein